MYKSDLQGNNPNHRLTNNADGNAYAEWTFNAGIDIAHLLTYASPNLSIIEDALEGMGKRLHANAAALYKISLEEPSVQASLVTEWKIEEKRLNLSGQTDSIIIVRDVEQLGWLESLRANMTVSGVIEELFQNFGVNEVQGRNGTFLIVPVFLAGICWGFVWIERQGVYREWSLSEITSSAMIANAIGFCVWRWQSFLVSDQISEVEFTNEILAREYGLTELIKAVSSSADLSVGLLSLLESSTKLVKGDFGLLTLMDTDGNAVRNVYSYNLPDTLDINNLAGPDSLINSLRAQPKPILIDNSDPRFTLNDEISGVILVPMMIGNQYLGAVSIYSKAVDQPLSLRDLILIETIGRQAAVLIHNSWLVQTLKRRTDEPEALRATSAISGRRSETTMQPEKPSSIDALTSILNRQYLLEAGDREFRRLQRESQSLSIIMIDIDRFKSFNETYGNPAGDRVLVTMAAECQRAVREFDLVGRYGGEEFVILLPEASSTNAVTVAERIRDRLAELPIHIGDTAVLISVSFGISSTQSGCKDLEELIQQAEKALYLAKSKGRGRISLWGQPDLLDD
jgi:diguanylate cyclase (GGDEF)-like protein